MMWEIKHGDCLEVLRTLPDESVQCCVTSPPYWGLRDYGTARWEGGSLECDHAQFLGGNGAASAKQVTSAGTQKYSYRGTCPKCGAIRVDGQLGLERTPEEYVAKMVEVFHEVRRVLRKDGTCFLNLGDSYFGSWGNYGGQNRGNGSQRDITTGSQALNPAYDGLEQMRPPTAFKHSSIKPKDLCGIPWMVAFALRSDGWYLRQDIIWHKPNPMPESVRDRCTKSHEYIFLLSKGERYYYDIDAIREPWSCDRDDMREKGVRTGLAYLQQGENGYSNSVKALPRSYNGSTFNKGKSAKAREHIAPIGETEREDSPIGRNKRSVWTLTTKPFPDAHFATFPPEIPELCIKAGTREGDTVLDPFNGAGTTGLVATRLNRNYLGIELNPAYVEMASNRIINDAPLFNLQTEPEPTLFTEVTE